MDAHIEIGTTVTFEPTGPRYTVSEATGKLTWFPRDTRLQRTSSLRVAPDASLSDDEFAFRWEKPGRTERIKVSADVRTLGAIVPVRERVAFPLQEVPPEVAMYLEAGEITDMNPEIQRLAQELAGDKTDAYEVVFTLADWTTSNINYSLASVGQPASQHSSQVLQSRWGKCDELTSLFISLNRALGIPARFVAGYAYTNSEQFDKPWGGHGWAEVWLPGQGWVPFDVTYGEYGYLDPGHVTLKTAPDAKETSIEYTARGNDFELRTQALEITVTPTNLVPQRSPAITVSLDAPQRTVGFGSAVLILATVRNERDYYVSTRLDLSKTRETDALSGTYENILLRPRETRTVPFLVRIEDGLAPGYQYTFPFTLRSHLGDEQTIEITVRQDATRYDESSYARILEGLSEGDAPQRTLSVTCASAGANYTGQRVQHACVVSTLDGTSPLIGLPQIELCEEPCKERQMVALEGGRFSLTTTDERAGIYTRTYTARAGEERARLFVTSRSIDPTLMRASIDAPASARADEEITATLLLNATGAVPHNVTVTMRARHSETDQLIETLQRPAQISFIMPGRALRPGENTLIAEISYTDELGTARTARAEQKITLTDVSLWNRANFWLEDGWYWVVGLF